MSLSEAFPTTAIDTVSEFTCRSATGQSEDLPKDAAASTAFALCTVVCQIYLHPS